MAFTGICQVMVHVELAQCKLSKNAGSGGIRVGERSVYILRSGVGGIASFHGPQLKHYLNRSVLNVLRTDFISKRPQVSGGGEGRSSCNAPPKIRKRCSKCSEAYHTYLKKGSALDPAIFTRAALLE